MRAKIWLLPVLGIFITLCIVLPAEGGKPGMAGDRLIRFHVIANSDSPEDQQLKLRIRDRVLDTLGKEFEEYVSVDAARDIIKDRLGEVERIAKDEIARSGKDYSAKAVLGSYNFPTKAYGSTYLPAGRYEALRVIIGRGMGANWWCVMFPPLCFVDISHGTAPEDTPPLPRKKAGWSVDDANQWEEMDAKEDTTMEFSFKIVQWWEDIKPKMTKALSFLTGDE